LCNFLCDLALDHEHVFSNRDRILPPRHARLCGRRSTGRLHGARRRLANTTF
jgi:hypothetical protein